MSEKAGPTETLIFPRMSDGIRNFLVTHGGQPKETPRPIRIHIDDCMVTYEQFVLDEHGQRVLSGGKPVVETRRVHQRDNCPRPPKRRR